MKKTGKEDMKTRAVIFVEQTPRGELAKEIREQLQGLEQVLKFRVRVVERACGTTPHVIIHPSESPAMSFCVESLGLHRAAPVSTDQHRSTPVSTGQPSFLGLDCNPVD